MDSSTITRETRLTFCDLIDDMAIFLSVVIIILESYTCARCAPQPHHVVHKKLHDLSILLSDFESQSFGPAQLKAITGNSGKLTAKEYSYARYNRGMG